MIQIQNPEQFKTAAGRLQHERMGVRRAEAHMYEVTNKAKGRTYHIRFHRTSGASLLRATAWPASATTRHRSCASTSPRP